MIALDKHAPVMVTLHKMRLEISPSQISKIFSGLLDYMPGHVLNFFRASPFKNEGDTRLLKKWGKMSQLHYLACTRLTPCHGSPL